MRCAARRAAAAPGYGSDDSTSGTRLRTPIAGCLRERVSRYAKHSAHAPKTPPFHRTDRFAASATRRPGRVLAPAGHAATDFTHCYARRSSNDERIPYTARVQ
ncbi:hypothetical protein C7S16_6300 [Burkholderia thailandensis]|uniref:Uncharacterized protein n=1 Tax=Burkholderia thailandensis TaxID=57975 RepID=A0AAW9CP06_BURTH|nr:hypothetical protein [Burkholderia thailandensis]MDW9251511.1 hypothetical protein [Burkholderia thailandensis]